MRFDLANGFWAGVGLLGSCLGLVFCLVIIMVDATIRPSPPEESA
jgi:hypothetical protein